MYIHTYMDSSKICNSARSILKTHKLIPLNNDASTINMNHVC